MDLDALTSSIHSLSLDTETTTTTSLSDKTDIINKASAKILEFNKFNETKFHFSKPKFEPNPIGKLLLKFLKCSLTYLDQVEKFECPEAYTLTDSYYLLACNCLNSIRILSRDTDVIESFTVDDLLDLVQQAADLKNLTINNKDCQVTVYFFVEKYIRPVKPLLLHEFIFKKSFKVIQLKSQVLLAKKS